MQMDELQLKLNSELQILPPELALEFCQKSLRDISRKHNWSWMYTRGIIRTPALINTGTVSVTQFSDEVIVSAATKTILDAITGNNVPLIGRQFRTFGGQIGGSNHFYTIREYDTATSKLYLTEFYVDATNAAATFQIFKAYYTAPNLVERRTNPEDPFDEIITFDGIDFSNFEYVYSPLTQRKLWLDRTRADLDRMDFSRTTTGDPYYIAGYGKDSSGNQLFELYPIPNQERIIQVLYKKEGRTLEPEESIPASLNYDLVLKGAKIKAYEWLAANGPQVGEKRSPNIFMNLHAMASNQNMEDSYPQLLAEAKMKDENLFPQALFDMGDSFPYYHEPIVEHVLLDF